MSNNKQTMKLYTEKQVLKFINDSFDEGCSHIIGLTPIKLPSDEEILERAFQQWGDYSKTSHQNAYIEGAKWMRNKIQGGNSE